MSDEQLVCVIDDDVSVREAIVDLVRSAGHEVEAFESAQAYLAVPRSIHPACLVLDLSLPGLSGLELQARLCSESIDIPIVFVSGHGDVPGSVQALKAGALDFLTKPFDPDALLAAVRAGLATRVRRSVPDVPRRPATLGPGRKAVAESPGRAGIIGRSGALGEVLAEVLTVADTDATVLIHGETGTGKELIARAIHEHSTRRHGPFVKVNCGAIPSGLLESELMGHERGAFTGAIAQRIGRFELAHDGTLFLDEVGEIALELQPKLLRVLQEREFERIGGSRTVRTNARVIAATNRNLREMVKARAFREDLYYRLDVFPIELPPLRARRQDIPELVEYFVKEFGVRFNKDVRSVSVAAMSRLQQYDWPGNVRELKNVVERAMIRAQGSTLEVPALQGAPLAPAVRAQDDLKAVNRAHILSVLEASGWVVAGPRGAAARLGVKRSTLNHRMKKLGILPLRSRLRGVDE